MPTLRPSSNLQPSLVTDRDEKEKAADDRRRERDIDRFMDRLQQRKIRSLRLSLLWIVVGVGAVGVSFTRDHHNYDVVAWMIFLASVIPAAWSFADYRRDRAKLRASESGTIHQRTFITAENGQRIDLNSIGPSRSDLANGYTKFIAAGESVLLSLDVNEKLRSHPFSLVHSTTKRDYVRNLIQHDPEDFGRVFMVKKRMSEERGARFFDDPKLCLMSLDPRNFTARYHRGSFYFTFLTNELCSQSLSRSSGDVDFSRLFPMDMDSELGPVLRPLDLSNLDDHIGISTLALTRDRVLVAWEQGRAEQSVGRMVPSGSGACDITHLRETLNATIAFAMQRELQEESGLKDKGFSVEQVGQTKLLGYFRWVRRGGKPEFVGISRLNFDSSDLFPEYRELVASAAKCYRYPCRDLAMLSQTLSSLSQETNLSVPLAVAIHILQEILRSDPQYVERFWFGDEPGVEFGSPRQGPVN